MINNFITYIQSIIIEYGALGVFFITLVEQIIPPIPSAFVSMVAGFFLLPAEGLFWNVLWQAMLIIAIPVTIGAIIGSLFFYSLAYWGGKSLIDKNKKRLCINWNQIEGAKKKLDNNPSDEIALFVLCLIPIIPSTAVSVFCGIIRYPLSKFIPIALVAFFFRAIIVSLIGWQAGEFYYVHLEQIATIESYLLIAFVFLILIGTGFLFYKKNKQKLQQNV